jgi:hypothetical protein
VWPEGKDKILRFERDDEDEQGDSDDSLFDILTGRTPIPELSVSRIEAEADEDMEGEQVEEDGLGYGDSVGTVQGLDDTFRGKRRQEYTNDGEETEGRDQSLYEEGVLGESGMSEMF